MTFKQKAKTLKSDDRRGVSPVIGVILMVAITVILAAVIGSFVLGMAGDISQNPQAGVTMDTQSNSIANVTITSMPNADDITVSQPGSGSIDNHFPDPAQVGETADISGLSAGDKIIVTATLDGNKAVIAEYTI